MYLCFPYTYVHVFIWSIIPVFMYLSVYLLYWEGREADFDPNRRPRPLGAQGILHIRIFIHPCIYILYIRIFMYLCFPYTYAHGFMWPIIPLSMYLCAVDIIIMYVCGVYIGVVCVCGEDDREGRTANFDPSRCLRPLGARFGLRLLYPYFRFTCIHVFRCIHVFYIRIFVGLCGQWYLYSCICVVCISCMCAVCIFVSSVCAEEAVEKGERLISILNPQPETPTPAP